MENIDPTTTKAWKNLRLHFRRNKNVRIKDLFDRDHDRFSKFSVVFDDQMLLDFSKNNITSETLRGLIDLADECKLVESIRSMFRGDAINRTEAHSVLHTALRRPTSSAFVVGRQNISTDVASTLSKMKSFCASVIDGRWKGYTRKRITDVVNIGIGGSHLGPRAVVEALRHYKNRLTVRFISNVDGTNATEVLKRIDPETTLFVVSSKSFCTQETLTNAESVKQWFLRHATHERHLLRHFVAVSSNVEKAEEFGICPRNVFKLWNWVGGRYSLWSAVGIPIALSLGFDNFRRLLSGAHNLDLHFLHAPFEKNLPVILGLLSIWYNNFFGYETEAVLPYDHCMDRLLLHLQQVSMESNGKSIDRNRRKVNYQTGPVVWGGIGTDGQHAFYQLMHQGTKIVPCDFIASVVSHNPMGHHHEQLLSNFLAQTRTLAFGCSKRQVEKKSNACNSSENKIKYSVPFRVLEGNRPTNSILLRKMTPRALGSLLALYEHKTFVQGVLLNVHSFDQWGVEFGKEVSDHILPNLRRTVSNRRLDGSTDGLLQCCRRWKERTKHASERFRSDR